MSANNQHIVYDHPSKTFIGVRFVLLGFDAFKKDKVRLKLVEGGGVDIGGYSPDCTHVIVDKLVYDDPICVAARNDGREVVTSLWVDHSCDVAMPVDTTSIMYRPLRDLNGIPRAKSLIVCLTGYLRQDRDDIMTMVGLMGANFSKPLVANKVTHLVCYKFEGEKYELAKKIKKIKVVNHRWLEDCLRAWEILPEADYNKSGYELEMMEAEAKDSDEEIDNMETKQCGDQKVDSPQNLRIGMKIPDEPFMFEQEISNINSSAAKRSLDLENTNQTLSATRKDTKPDAATWPQEILSRTLDFPSSHDIGTPCEASGFVSNPFDKAPSAEKVGSDVSGTKITKMTPHLHGSYPSATYSRRTGKASLPMSSGQKQESNVGSPTLNGGKLKVSDGFSTSPSSLGPDETTSSCAKTIIQNFSHPEGGQSSALHGKRKITLSHDSPKLQKNCQNVQIISDNPLTVNRMEKSASLGTHASHETLKQFSPLKSASFMDKNEVTGRRQSFSDISKTVTSEMNRESSAEALQTSSKEFENSCSVSKVANVEANGQSVSEHMVPNEGDDTSPSSESKMTGIKKPSGSAQVGLRREGDANSVQKPLKKKMLARKVLGSTSRFSKGNLARKKCSIDTNKTVFSDDSGTKTVGREGVEEPERLVNSENVEAFHPKDCADTGNITKTRNFAESETGVSNRTGLMDDETEAPEGEDFRVALHKKIPDAVEAPHSIDVLLAEELNAPCGPKQTDSHISGEDQLNEAGIDNCISEAEKTVCDNLVETPLVKTVAERLTKGTKRRLTKTDKNNLSNAIKVASYGDTQNDGSRHEENHVKTEKKKEICSKATLKSKKSAPLKKSKTSLGVEKENRPVDFGGKDANNDEEINEKMASKSKKKPFISEMKSTKDNSNLKPVEPIPKVGKEPVWFMLSGHRWQRKEFQQVIKRLKGRVCRDSHNWSYQATHLIVPDPIRRTEKVFAAAASGRWILMSDYLTASCEARKFLTEQPYEWYKTGLSQDGAINLEAPRKWRLLRERTGHGAFHGMRVIVYGECIAPSLDTLKRAVKAGDGTILATSPPYTRFLQSGIDFAIVSPGMPRVDMWVQEFLKHEIPCVLADYLVEYICKPGYSLDRHVQYGTHAWANRSLKNLMNRIVEVVEDPSTPEEYTNSDTPCEVCGSRDRGEVMLICGDERGSSGCGIGTHIDCCDPLLDEVPEEDWFCPKCRKTEGGTNKQPCFKKRKCKSRRK